MTAVMRFKNLSWRFNPHTVKVSSEMDVAESHIPFGNNTTESFGRNARIVTGEGYLCGEDCFSQHRELWKLYKEENSGILSLPEFLVMKAYFSSLQIIGEPSDNLIRYIFTFTEVVEDKDFLIHTTHTVLKNESLWDISYRYNISVEELLSFNSHLRHPYDTEEGQVIKLC